MAVLHNNRLLLVMVMGLSAAVSHWTAGNTKDTASLSVVPCSSA